MTFVLSPAGCRLLRLHLGSSCSISLGKIKFHDSVNMGNVSVPGPHQSCDQWGPEDFHAGVHNSVPKQREFRFQPLDGRRLHNKLVFITSREISCAGVKRNSGGGKRKRGQNLTRCKIKIEEHIRIYRIKIQECIRIYRSIVAKLC